MNTPFNIKPWYQHKLVKRSAQLLSANVVAQVIGFCVYPLLTRLYAPSDFGLLNLFLTLGGVLVLFATGAYYSAIVLPKQTSEGAACFHVGMLCNLCVTLLCALSVFFAPSIAQLLHVPSLANWYFLLPLFVFLSATWQLLNYWYVRTHQFGAISAYQIGQSTLNAGAKWMFGATQFLQGGMLCAVVLAPLLSLLAVVMRSFATIKPLFTVQWSQCKAMAHAYRKFPQFTLPKQLVNYMGGNMPILLLTPFFDLSYIGYFGMALTLSFVPLSVVTKSFYQVLFSDVTALVHKGASVWQNYRRLVGWSALLITVSFTGLFFALPSVTSWLLGESWGVVGSYIQLMLPWLAIIAITNTFDFIFDVFGKQDKQFYFEIALFVLRALALLLGIYYQDFFLAVACFSAVSFVLRLVYATYQYYLLQQYEKQRCKSN